MKLLNFDHEELRAKLDNYLQTDEFFAKVFAYTKQRFEAAAHLSAHNWAHSYRDTLNAIVVGEGEEADMSIVLPAACMHDIGFLYGAEGKTHGAVGADSLADYLTKGGIEASEEKIKRIAECIRTHKGSLLDEKPESLEAKVVADADMLEKFGPFGVYQHIRTFAEFNWPLEKQLKRRTEVMEIVLQTPTGNRLAEPGRQFVADFYKELTEAAQPYGLEPSKEESL